MPRKRSGDTVRKPFMVRLNDAERELLMAGADRRKMGPSGYLRWLVANDVAGVDWVKIAADADALIHQAGGTVERESCEGSSVTIIQTPPASAETIESRRKRALSRVNRTAEEGE